MIMRYVAYKETPAERAEIKAAEIAWARRNAQRGTDPAPTVQYGARAVAPSAAASAH